MKLTPRTSYPRFYIINGKVVLIPDGMCVHSALVDVLEMEIEHAIKLLNIWHEAFGAECYNDSLTALNAETEQVLRESTATQTGLGICTPRVLREESTS